MKVLARSRYGAAKKRLRADSIRSPAACRGMHAAAGHSSRNTPTVIDFAITRADWSRRRNPPLQAEPRDECPFACAAPRSAFTELTGRFDIAAPIGRKQSGAHVAMKRRMWPIAHARDQSVLDRIDAAI